ncbi:DUF6314 family protein [Rhizobium calliandrae]|uniref:DUF6314 family protein n=1 Tax=Rhizobium calliandrae TaxID=1312182 RepID=UPI003D80AF31
MSPIGNGASQRLAYQCGLDLYRGHLFFRGPDPWAELWLVWGARKDCLSLARYRRA